MQKTDTDTSSSVSRDDCFLGDHEAPHSKLSFFVTKIVKPFLSILLVGGVYFAITATWFYQQQSAKKSYSTTISATTLHHNLILDTNDHLIKSVVTREVSPYGYHLTAYPSTGIEPIDNYIKQRISLIDTSSRLPSYTYLYNDSAQIYSSELHSTLVYRDQTSLSITLRSYGTNFLYNNHYANSDYVEYFTFDTQSGQRISTNSLFDTLSAGMDDLVKAVRLVLKNKYSVSEDKLQQQITPMTLHNFIVKDRHTIGFIFDKKALGIGLSGDVSVTVPIKNFSHYLQNQTARRFFSIPPLDAHTARLRSTKQLCQRCIALTFDDGPGQYTDTLLSTLQNHEAKATFFVIGKNIRRFNSTLQRATQEGHQIGNHTWNHPELPKINPDQIRKEIQQTSDMIAATTGTPPTIVRPPYGAVDDKVYNELRTMSLSAILWSIDTRDWANRDSSIVCQRAVASAQPGAIILMHDIHRTTVEAVPCILSTLHKQGYQFVTINNLLRQPLQPGIGYFKR